jgi:hypothetical protein
MSHIENLVQVFNPSMPKSMTPSLTTVSIQPDTGIPFPELAKMLTLNPTETRGIPFQQSIFSESPKSPFPVDSGISMATAVIGLVSMLIVRRHRC